jgi:mannose-6-phosphate isomerase class I
MHAFDIANLKDRLVAAGGGYEIVHETPGLELAVYVLVAPEPDQQQPHADDEVYVVLEGTGVLDVEGTAVPVKEGDAVFVEAGAEHRFSAYEQLSCSSSSTAGLRQTRSPFRVRPDAPHATNCDPPQKRRRIR